MSNQNNNDAKIATIGRKVESEKIDYLLDKLFEIPAYQRLYEWESAQIEELLNDIKKAWEPYILQDSKSSEDLQKFIKPYFIGNITTSAKRNKGEHDKTNGEQNKMYVLIDGQQRLTTLWFIGFYLASREYKWEKEITKRVWQNFILQNDKLRIAMPIRNNEEKALKDIAMKIQNDTIKPNENGEINLYTYLPSDIHQKIINAFECIEKWFNRMFGKYTNGKLEIDLKQLKCFSLFIYTKVCFVFVELAQNTDLNRFFVRMNNRGKQLEKHEILKARILSVIQEGGGEWQKYAKIWDSCSDMNKYIFRSENDREILNPKSKNDNNKGETETTEQTNDKLVHLAEIAEKYTIIKDNKKVKDNGAHSGAESIIDFPTFLLHCYKLWVAKKCSGKIDKITIAKDKLLEIMWDNQTNNGKNKEVILDDTFIFNIKNDTNEQAKENCKEFIIDMLRYRVLFDYFVIKNTLSDDGFAIMQLDSNNQPKKKVFENLAMIQNYLRVARQGDRQNYHHWLTPFLKFLDKSESINYNYIKISSWNPDKICKNFANNNKDKQDDLVKFLETLDTNLAIAQLGDNELLDETNKAIKEVQNYQPTETPASIDLDSLLNNGTGTPHYWFYRLEYYLWKWGKHNQTKLAEIENKFGIKIYNAKLGEGKDETKFSDIFIKNLFHFRMLGSIEHFSAIQRQDKREKEWNLDIFGNLALISQNFNSSLSNQLEQFKKDEVIKQLKRGRLESLKYFIMCANLNGNEWTYDNAQAHQEQMIKILIESLKDSKGN